MALIKVFSQGCIEEAFGVVSAGLGEAGFTLIDCQQTTAHLLRFGASEISRQEFLRRVINGRDAGLRLGRWSLEA